MSERKMDQSGASGPTEGVRGPLADHRSQSLSEVEESLDLEFAAYFMVAGRDREHDELTFRAGFEAGWEAREHADHEAFLARVKAVNEALDAKPIKGAHASIFGPDGEVEL